VAEGGSPPLAAVGLMAVGYVSACPVQSAGLAVLWLGHGLELVGCRGGGPGRWTARLALRRATLRWWWSHSSAMRMAWSGRREILVLAALRLWQLPDRGLGTFLGGSGRLSSRAWCEATSGRKLSAEAPTTAMPAGVVTLLGASLWVPSPRYGSG
jgi:hypothetical protein